MNVPPGTWTADTSALNANGGAAHTRSTGPEASRRRFHAATQQERDQRQSPDEHAEDEQRRDQPADAGHEQRPPAHTQEVVQAGRDRDAVSTRRCPDDTEPCQTRWTAQRPEHRPRTWRRYQGTTGDGERATAPSAAASGIRAGRLGLPPEPRTVRHAIHQERGASTARRRRVVARPVRRPGEEPGDGEGAGVAAQAPAARNSEPATSGWLQGEVCPAGPMSTRTTTPGTRRHARRPPPRTYEEARPCPADRPRQRRGERARDRERQRRGHRRRAQAHADERHRYQGRQRRPVRALDAIGSTGYGGIGPTDLREDPDEVHVEAVAGRQLAGDVHVVEEESG